MRECKCPEEVERCIHINGKVYQAWRRGFTPPPSYYEILECTYSEKEAIKVWNELEMKALSE